MFTLLFPTINLKYALSNSQVYDNKECIAISNAMLGRKFSVSESWMSSHRPGLSTEFILFCIQIIYSGS